MMENVNSVNPLVSVIIPCYNAEHFVVEAVRSIMNQSYTNLEILCCDDCSTDGTLAILEQLANDDSRIKILRHKMNMKLIDTLNELVDASSGSYIARMDADDISLPDRIVKQLAFMMQNSQIDFCGCNTFHINEEGKIVGKTVLPQVYEDVKFFLPYFSTFYHPTVFARAGVLKKNPYDKNFIHAEDYELWCRLIFEKEMKGVNLRERLLKYRINFQGVSKQNSQLQTENASKVFDFINCGLEKTFHKNVFFRHTQEISKNDFLYLKILKKDFSSKNFKLSVVPYCKLLFHLWKFQQVSYFINMLFCPLGIYSLFKIFTRKKGVK